jgi:TRAP-type C4-dicarboxylate transport system permease small subunit
MSDGGGQPPAASTPERLVGRVARAGAAAAALLVLATLALVAYAVAMRYLLGAPVTWADELAGYLVVAMVMLGAADALLRGDHIAVDLLTDRLRPAARRLLDAWAMLCVLAVAAAIGWSAWLMVGFSLDFGMYSEGYLEAPMWVPQSLVLLGAGLLLLAGLARLATLLRRRGRR